MKGARKIQAATAIALLEEVFQTAKRLPLVAWGMYYGATFPFMLAFLYFWADMSNDAFAADRLALGAVLLGALFIVAKTGHVLFTRQVMAYATGEVEQPRLRLAQVLMNQTIFHCTGLMVLPLCLLMIVPFGWAYSVYQNVTVLDDGRKRLRDLFADARQQAGVNRMQCNVMLWLICPYAVPLAAGFFMLIFPIMRSVTPEWTDAFFGLYAGILWTILIPLSPFGMIVAVNLAAALATLPMLLKMLFGIDTVFSISPGGMANPTFFTIVSGLTYLCLDPLVKIAYGLRCFYGDSIHTGKDLRLKLAHIAQRAVLLLVLLGGLLAGFGAQAQDSAAGAPEATALDQAIDDTLRDPRFAWRAPRERPEAGSLGAFQSIADALADIGQWIGEKFDAFLKWLEKFFSRADRDRSGGGGVSQGVLRTTATVLLAALFGVLVYVGWKTWRRTTVVMATPLVASPAVPDLEDEGTTADALASNEWLKLAEELLSRGEIRLAMRAYFFAGLARLAQLRLIRITAYKSNREYLRELRRVEHARGEAINVFHLNLRMFESVWYGDHDLGEEDLNAYIGGMKRISVLE